jgi:hypothetical protein
MQSPGFFIFSFAAAIFDVIIEHAFYFSSFIIQSFFHIMDFEQLQTLSIFAPPKKFLPHEDLSEKRKKMEAGRLSKACWN